MYESNQRSRVIGARVRTLRSTTRADEDGAHGKVRYVYDREHGSADTCTENAVGVVISMAIGVAWHGTLAVSVRLRLDYHTRTIINLYLKKSCSHTQIPLSIPHSTVYRTAGLYIIALAPLLRGPYRRATRPKAKLKREANRRNIKLLETCTPWCTLGLASSFSELQD